MKTVTFVNKGHLYQVDSPHTDGIVVRKFEVDISSSQISLVKKYLWKCKSHVRLAAAASVKEIITGSQRPVILVSVGGSGKDNPVNVLYILCVETECIVAINRCEIKWVFAGMPYECINLANGPSVILHGKLGICVYKRSYSIGTDTLNEECKLQYNTLDISKHHVCCKEARPKYCKAVDFVCIHTSKTRQFVLSGLTLKASCSTHKYRSTKCVHVCQLVENKVKTLQTEQFIPKEYLTTISSMCVVNINCESEDVFSSTLCIGTIDAFVLLISNGRLLKCVSLSNSMFDCSSEQSISHVAVLREGTSRSVNKLIVCQEKEDKWTVLNKQLRVEETYTDVCQVFVGDFASFGSLQYLLLKDEDIEKAQWILTDLSSLHLQSTQTKKMEREGSSQQTSDGLVQNTGTVLQALRSRLQSEKLCLIEEKQLCRQRAKFLDEECSRCQQNSCGRPSQPTGLVPLITGHVRSGQSSVKLQDDQPVVKVQEVWQRTMKGQWCIGAEVVNTSGRSLQMSLQLVLSSDSDLKTTRTVSSQTIPTSTASSRPQEGILDILRAGTLEHTVAATVSGRNNSTVVCVTPVPDFCGSAKCTAAVMLHVSVLSDGNTDSTDHVPTRTNREPAVEVVKAGTQHTWLVPCGEVELTSTDVVHGRHEVKREPGVMMGGDLLQLKEFQRNQLALRQTLTLHQLTLRSSPGILSDLDSLLPDRCGLAYAESLDCFIASNQTGLDSVHLNLGPVRGQNCRDIEIYTSCERELFLVIHHLYSCLPDNILILPRDPGSSTLQHNLRSSLGREIHTLTARISDILNNRGSTGVTKCDDGGDVVEDDGESLRRVGEKFKKSRERLVKKQTESVGEDETQKLVQLARGLQERTDLAVARLGNR